MWYCDYPKRITIQDHIQDAQEVWQRKMGTCATVVYCNKDEVEVFQKQTALQVLPSPTLTRRNFWIGV